MEFTNSKVTALLASTIPKEKVYIVQYWMQWVFSFDRISWCQAHWWCPESTQTSDHWQWKCPQILVNAGICYLHCRWKDSSSTLESSPILKNLTLLRLLSFQSKWALPLSWDSTAACTMSTRNGIQSFCLLNNIASSTWKIITSLASLYKSWQSLHWLHPMGQLHCQRYKDCQCCIWLSGGWQECITIITV